jgi:uncharacterized phiE125 gp8 family phage protein
MPIVLATAPAAEPVTLTEAKTHLRVTHTDDDTYITALIKVARQMAEQLTGRQLITATWDLYLDRFPDGSGRVLEELDRYAIRVPLPRLQSVTHVKYYDLDNTLQTLSASAYTVDIRSEPARIAPAYGYTWPATRDDLAVVNVRFIAGYGAAADVPEGLKQWVLLRIGTMYANREEVAAVPNIATLGFADRLLDPYRITQCA